MYNRFCGLLYDIASRPVSGDGIESTSKEAVATQRRCHPAFFLDGSRQTTENPIIASIEVGFRTRLIKYTNMEYLHTGSCHVPYASDSSAHNFTSCAICFRDQCVLVYNTCHACLRDHCRRVYIMCHLHQRSLHTGLYHVP